MYVFLLTIFCAASGVLSSSIGNPCKINDIPCLLKLANDLRPVLFAGADPLTVKEVTGELNGIKYKLTDASFVGIASCKVTNLNYPETVGLQVNIEEDLACPKLTMTGKYELAGQVSGAPTEGHGEFSFTTGNYLIHLQAQLIKFFDKIDKGEVVHVSLKDFELKMTPDEPVKFESVSFDGPKELADSFSMFNNENWKDSTGSIQKPILYTSFESAYLIINEVLKNVSVRDYIVN